MNNGPPPEVARHLTEVDDRIMSSGKAATLEEFMTPLGCDSLRTYLITKAPLRDHVDTIIGIIGIARDITERKRAEEERRRAHAETERLLCSISSVLIGVDIDDKITRWNNVSEGLFGVSAKNAVGKSFFECGIQWDWIAVLESFEKSRDDNVPTRVDDLRYTQADGKEGFLINFETENR